MTQYTETVEEFSKKIDYIDQMNKVSYIHAINGTYEVAFNHGGSTITVLRDGVIYENVTYKKGDVITVPPTDAEYVRLIDELRPSGNAIIDRLKRYLNA